VIVLQVGEHPLAPTEAKPRVNLRKHGQGLFLPSGQQRFGEEVMQVRPRVLRRDQLPCSRRARPRRIVATDVDEEAVVNLSDLGPRDGRDDMGVTVAGRPTAEK
jgi:hypothetical protein